MEQVRCCWPGTGRSCSRASGQHSSGSSTSWLCYRALSAGGFTLAPQVRGRWRDEEVYPFPFAEVTRLTGTRPADPAALFGPLGAVLARVHQVPPPDLPWPRRIARHQRQAYRWLHRALDPATSGDAAVEAARRLDRPGQLAIWRQRLGVAAAHRHVLVHGDIHEHQLLVTEGEITGILDWETARLDHPFWDFDLGEWGTGLWRRQRASFAKLWAAAWRGVRRGARNRPGPGAAGDGVPAAPGAGPAGR